MKLPGWNPRITQRLRRNALKSPAGMSKHRGAGSEGCILRLAAMRSPRANGISKKETPDEDRRLKEKSEHGIHPIVPPVLLRRPDIGRHHDLMGTCSSEKAVAIKSQALRANSHGGIMP
jgi:hypothetical protein